MMMQQETMVSSGAALFLLLMLSTTAFFPPASAILHPVDFLALQSIRKSLWDLPGSTFFSTWDFTSDPCSSFSGVLCSSSSPARVISLALGDPRAGSPGLAGHLHPSLGRLSALAELSLVPGRVVGPLPATLSSLRNLRFLAASRNYLSGPIPSSFSSLRRLRTLDLSFNLLTGAIPHGLLSVPSLANLILCHNRLSGNIPASSTSSLTRLDLKRNSLSGHIPPLPSSVQYLSLSSNSLSGRIDTFLPSLTHLNYLDLSMNKLSGPIPGCVFLFPITTLQLQRNELSGPVLPAGKVTIRTVDLSYNRLTGMVSPLLETVRRLYLNNNRFAGQVPAGFVQRVLDAGMEVLYLQHNFLTGIAMGPAAEIPATSSLCLQYNCMVPPVQAPCPGRAGKQKTRPVAQCRGLIHPKKNRKKE